MNTFSTRETMVLVAAAAQAARAADRRPALRLAWSLDPMTGKPVARWVIEDAETAGLALASAA